MMLTRIWERYFLREIIRSCLFFLSTFYGLYVLIDYASHAASFHHHVQFQVKETIIYYACEFTKRLDVLLPFSLLIASVRTLCTLNTHNELVALMSSGISLRTLMRPFVFVGLACTLIIYLNSEFLFPLSSSTLKHIEDSRRSQKGKHKDSHAAAQHIVMEDHSTVIFQNFDSAKNLFFDVFWIVNINDIYRIKFLSPSNPPVGHFIDHLVRNDEGQLEAVESFSSLPLPNMVFNKQILFETITPPEELAFSELKDKLPKSALISEKEAQTLAAFYRKLCMPWLCLFAVIAPAPFCLRSTRTLPVFFIYAGSIFGLVAFYLVMSAAAVLAKRQVIPPLWAIWPPFILFSSIFCWRFFRMR